MPQGTSSTSVLQLTDWPTEWLTDWRFEDFEETQLVQQRLLHQVRPSYKRVSIWETTTAPAQSHAVVKTRCIKKNTMAPAFSYPIRSWTENPVWFSEEHSAWEQYNAFNRPNSKNSQKPPFWHFGSFKNAFWSSKPVKPVKPVEWKRHIQKTRALLRKHVNQIHLDTNNPYGNLEKEYWTLI